MNKIFGTLISLIFWSLIAFVTLDTMGYFNGDVDTLLNTIFKVEGKSDRDKIDSKGELITETEKSNLESSKLTGEDYDVNPVFYPYYEMLGEDEKIVYKQIYANAKERTSTFVPVEELLVDTIAKIVESVYNDHPELFWLDTSFEYKYTENNTCVQIILNFNETNDSFEESKYLFDTVVNEIVGYAKDLETDYEKEKYVHNTLLEMLEYNTDAPLNQSSYSAIVNKSSVCAGYARAFQHIMIQLGIPTYYVTGDADGDHAWNIIKLNDGYYNVDLTWDDNDVNIYAYFNLTDEEISKTHTRNRLALNLPTCKDITYKGFISYKEDMKLLFFM